MSLIGPRPQLVRDMVFMTNEQRKRHTAKPGLSGLAQINGRNSISWEDKMNWDIEYIEKKDVDTTRYSLSTKAADAIASGSNIFVYGSRECGVIEYMESTECSMVCSNKEELVDKLKELIYNKILQKKLYDRAIEVDIEDHDKEKNRSLTESMFVKLIQDTRANVYTKHKRGCSFCYISVHKLYCSEKQNTDYYKNFIYERIITNRCRTIFGR